MAPSSSLVHQVELSAFFAKTLADFQRAATDPIDRMYRICGLPVRLRFAQRSLVAPMTRALAHLEESNESEAALTLSIFDTASSGVPLNAPHWFLTGLLARGELALPVSSRYRAVFSTSSSILNLFDEERCEGLFFAQDIRQLRPWDAAAPFLSLLHLFLRRQQIQVVHAAAVANEKGDGALLVGPGGAGKSTTSIGCLGSGMRFLGDDYTAVDCRPPYRVHSLYSSGKLTALSLQLLGISETTSIHPEEEKALLFFQEGFAPLITRTANLKAIILPAVGSQKEGSYQPLSPAETLRAFAPSCILQLAYSGTELFSRLSNLVREVPCFRLVLGSDPIDNSRLIREILA